jgi:hypothetical protein
MHVWVVRIHTYVYKCVCMCVCVYLEQGALQYFAAAARDASVHQILLAEFDGHAGVPVCVWASVVRGSVA